MKKKFLLTSVAVLSAAVAFKTAPVHAYGNWTGWNNGGAGSTNATAPTTNPVGERNSRNPLVKYGYIKYNRVAAEGYTKHVRVTVVDGGGRPVPNTEIDIQIIPTGNRASEQKQYENFTVKTNQSGDADFSEILVPSFDAKGQPVKNAAGEQVTEPLKFQTGEVLKFRVTNPTPDFKSATGLEATLTVGGDMYTNGRVVLPYKLDDRSVQIGNPTSTAVSGWAETKEGWKYFENAKAVTGWKQVDGKWYFLNAEGVMQKWWVKDNGTWYYLNGSGEMQTGWLQDNGTWYYLEGSGAMKASQWFEVEGKWYYVDATGALAVNTTVDGYTVNANGEWV